MRLALIAASCLALAACATTGGTAVTEAKGTATAWTSLKAVAVTLDGLATSHVLHGQKALDVARDLQKATDALTAADDARKRGDSATAQQNVAVASALIATLITIAANPGAPQ